VTALEVGTHLRPDGPCPVNLDADSSRITRLSVRVDSGTGVWVREYPAESRAVLLLGTRLNESVAVYLRAPDLARVIDAMNDAYTRVARRPYDDEPSPTSGSA
jgi:hypothetical protein